MIKQPNEIVPHDNTNPIIGSPMTSMEFTMYEPGSGAQNEAVNFPANNGGGGAPGQPQNQLLKQLLGNCSSADNPPAAGSPTTPTIQVVSDPKMNNHIEPGGGVAGVSMNVIPGTSSTGPTIPIIPIRSLPAKVIPNITPKSIPTVSKVNPPHVKVAPSKPPKDDYIAKRRAQLEKEKTPPPKEPPTRKRVRGPNKRTKNQLSDVKGSNDDTSNQNASSDTSQQATDISISQGPPSRKRVRKSNAHTDQNSSINTNLVSGISGPITATTPGASGANLNNSDKFAESILNKINNELPNLEVREPDMKIDNNVCSIFGCGNLNSLSSKLRGNFGKAEPLPSALIGLDWKRFNKIRPIGNYNEEFPLNDELNIELNHQHHKQMIEARDCDSPTSIVSNSSSEGDNDEELIVETRQDCENTISLCFRNHEDDYNMTSSVYNTKSSSIYTPNIDKFLNYDRCTTKDMNNNGKRPKTPTIPLDMELPSIDSIDIVKMELTDRFIAKTNDDDHDKENVSNQKIDCNDILMNSSFALPTTTMTTTTTSNQPTTPLLTASTTNSSQTNTLLNMRFRDHGNVSVTLTLTNKETDGVKRVLNSLSQLIDYPIRSASCLSPSSATQLTSDNNNSPSFNTSSSGNEDKIIGNTTTFRLITSPKSNQQQKQPHLRLDVNHQHATNQLLSTNGQNNNNNNNNDNNEITFRDNDDNENQFRSSSSSSKSQLDIKPEFCCRCNALVVDRGIRKLTSEIPETTQESIRRSRNNLNEQLSMELIFCSVHCYAATIMCSKEEEAKDHADSGDTKAESKMIVEHENIRDNHHNPQQQRTSEEQEAILNAAIQLSNRKRWHNIKYKRWTKSHRIIEKREPSPDGESLERQLNDHMMELDHMNPDQQGLLMVDKRRCVLCHEVGDGHSDGPARLLNLFIDGWVHLNCALWSLDVYELGNGALMNVELACRKAMICSLCRKPGATLKCFRPKCPNYYHFLCATKERCSFYEDKSLQCRQHTKSVVKEMTSFVVKRRVYINRDEQKQIAEMIQGMDGRNDHQNVMRIGSLVFLNIGQLLPHQLSQFHDTQCIYPVGYRAVRYYWSYRRSNKRCKYLCTIEDKKGRPEFKVVAQEGQEGFEDETFVGSTAQLAWRPIIESIVELRNRLPDYITTFPAYIRGNDLFGLSEPTVVRILESLPGVETLTDYEFKFGRSPLFELPLAINPSGCARAEPKLRTHLKRPYTIQSANCVPKSGILQNYTLTGAEALSSPYIKQFVHSKSSQYRKMKSEWRNNVVLARSSVQGLGLYAARDIEKHTMVIEYIGMLIRNEIAEKYEKIHEAHNRGIYMFRLDEDRVIDATLAGGLARYINHSCNPNCVAEAVEIDRERKILIIANRKILKGEELAYDYMLAIEDDQHKISCLCGASTCKKFMN